MKKAQQIASTLLVHIAMIITALFSLITVFGFCGTIYWFFDLFSYHRLQYMALLLACAGTLLTFKKWREAAVAFLFGMLNLSLIMPLYWPRGVDGIDAPRQRALLLNLQYSNREYELVYEFVHHVDPDFILFEEVTSQWAEALKELGAYPFFVIEARESCTGIALFSRIPLNETEIFTINETAPPDLIAQIDLEGQPLTIIGTHPSPPLGPVDYQTSMDQLSNLARIASETRGAVMLLGDLNSTSWGSYFNRLVYDANLSDSRKGYGLQPSFPARDLILGQFLYLTPIDHILISSEILVLDRSLGPYVGSDHYPVVVDFSINSDLE